MVALALVACSGQQMLSQLNATLEEENKALVEQVNKLVEQVKRESVSLCSYVEHM